MLKEYFKVKKSHFQLRWQEYCKRERRMSYGNDNADKTFYVISYDYETQGLFAIVKSVLSHVMYAVDRGWVPVVDLKNYNCQYYKEGVNAWEMYFEQPCGYTLSDIQTCKNVVKSYYGLYPHGHYDFYTDVLDEKEKYRHIAEQYRKYIIPQPQVLHYMRNMKNELHIDELTLGILCRGTDYLNRKPHNHPRQPDPKNVVKDANEFMVDKGYTSVFVATEDEQVLQMFRNAFGDRLRYLNQPRLKLKADQQYLSDVNTEFDTRHQIALDYYTALYILSQCSALIAGRTAGTLGAVFMSDGFKYSQFYDLGHYE